MAVSGMRGSQLLYDGGGSPYTWPGFSSSSLSLPNAQGGGCDDSIIQDVGMAASGFYYLSSSGTGLGFYIGSVDRKIGSIASNVYACESLQDQHSLGISVGYRVINAPAFSESAFPTWTWSSYFGFGRQGTIAVGSATATYIYYTDGAFGRVISGGIAITALGGIAATTLTMPSFPYDPLGAMIGTVTIS